MKKIIYTNIFLLLCLFIYSCDEDDSASCNDPSQIIDDCGICRDSESSQDWNATMDDCGICNGNNSACSACMDPEAFTYDETAQFHDCTDCQYDYVSLYITDDGNISLEVDDDQTMYPGNIVVIRTNQKIGFVNQLDNNITFSLNKCISSANTCSDLCMEYGSSICDFFDGCEWNESQNQCTSAINVCNSIDSEEECSTNSDCFWQSDVSISPYINIPYLQSFNYDESYDYSITIPWMNYTINGTIIVNDYEN